MLWYMYILAIYISDTPVLVGAKITILRSFQHISKVCGLHQRPSIGQFIVPKVAGRGGDASL